jgi:hypothetical protein
LVRLRRIIAADGGERSINTEDTEDTEEKQKPQQKIEGGEREGSSRRALTLFRMKFPPISCSLPLLSSASSVSRLLHPLSLSRSCERQEGLKFFCGTLGVDVLTRHKLMHLPDPNHP